MRELCRIFGRLLSWGVDRYAHMSIAMVIASVMLAVLCWLPWWSSLAISMLVTLSCIVVKDFAIDAKADLVDVVFGLIGALLAWAVWILAIIMY